MKNIINASEKDKTIQQKSPLHPLDQTEKVTQSDSSLLETSTHFKNRGGVYTKNGSYENADADFKRALELENNKEKKDELTKLINDLDNLRYNVKMARTSNKFSNSYISTLGYYQEILQNFPNHFEAVTKVASILTNSGNLEEIEQAAAVINDAGITANLDNQENKDIYLNCITKIAVHLHNEDVRTDEGLRVNKIALKLYKTAHDNFTDEQSQKAYLECVAKIALPLKNEDITTAQGLDHHKTALEIYEIALQIFPNEQTLHDALNNSVDILEARADDLTQNSIHFMNDSSFLAGKNELTISLHIWERISTYKKITVENIQFITDQLTGLDDKIESAQTSFFTNLLQNAIEKAEKVKNNSNKLPEISEDVKNIINNAVRSSWLEIEAYHEALVQNPTVIATIASSIKQEKIKGNRKGDIIFKNSAQKSDEAFHNLFTSNCNIVSRAEVSDYDHKQDFSTTSSNYDKKLLKKASVDPSEPSAPPYLANVTAVTYATTGTKQSNSDMVTVHEQGFTTTSSNDHQQKLKNGSLALSEPAYLTNATAVTIETTATQQFDKDMETRVATSLDESPSISVTNLQDNDRKKPEGKEAIPLITTDTKQANTDLDNLMSTFPKTPCTPVTAINVKQNELAKSEKKIAETGDKLIAIMR